jgi:hypothetical protein
MSTGQIPGQPTIFKVDDRFFETTYKSRWFLIEKEFCFYVACERDGMHIRIVYGDNSSNRPRYGSKDEARADAETIVKALNERDTVSSHQSTSTKEG